MIRELRDAGEPLHVDAVRHDADLFRRAAELALDLRIELEQRIDVICRIVRHTREMIEIRDPDGLEIAFRPIALDDLRLALARIDAVLRNHERLAVRRRRDAAEHAAVARRDAVVDIRRWEFPLQQIKERQQHRPHRPEIIRERQIAEPFAVDALDDVEEIA